MGQLARQRIFQDRTSVGNDRLVLLSLADFIPDDCYTCYPSVQTLAEMVNVSDRQIQRIIARLSELGALGVILGRGRHHTTRYAVLVGLSESEKRTAMLELNGDTAMSPIIEKNGDIKHDIAMSPLPREKVTFEREKVTFEARKGDTAMSPEQNEQKKNRGDRVAPAGSSAVTAPVLPTDHARLMTEYANALGYKLPNGAKEASAAQRILAAGYTVEQTLTAYHEMKRKPFWSDKHLSLHNVYGDMGALLAIQKPKPQPTPRAIPEPYDYSQEESPYSEAYQARLKASMRGAK